jgi:hypothetical protein
MVFQFIICRTVENHLSEGKEAPLQTDPSGRYFAHERSSETLAAILGQWRCMINSFGNTNLAWKLLPTE